MSPSYISRVTPPTFVIVQRPPSSCHPHTSHVSLGPLSSLYHAHLPRVTLPHPTCRSAHLHHCATPTFLVSPSHIPRVARPTFIIVPRPPSSCHPHIPRVARPRHRLYRPTSQDQSSHCETYNSHTIKVTHYCLPCRCIADSVVSGLVNGLWTSADNPTTLISRTQSVI